ncbi:MAG: ATP-binding protein, partial [Alphaproteobacteria bacterium]
MFRITRDRFLPALLGLSSMVLILLGVWGFDVSQVRSHLADDSASILEVLSKTRARLEAAVNERVNLAVGLAGFAKHGNLSQEEFQLFTTELLMQVRGIRSLQLAPGGVVTFVRPLEGNEAALGHDLLKDPKRKEEAERAIRERRMVVSGPVALRQGGMALIARLPVFNEASPTSERGTFWGFAVVVVNMEPVFDAGGLDALSDRFLIGIRAKGETEKRESAFFGDDSAFDGDAITSEIRLPGGTWQIAMKPRHGWHGDWNGREWFLGGGVVMALLVGGLIFSQTLAAARLRQSEARMQSSVIRLQRQMIDQSIIAAILKLAHMGARSRDEILQEALQLVLSTHGFSHMAKGCIMIRNGSALEMVARQGLPPDLLAECALVPFGKCLCGRVAETGEAIHVTEICDRHEVTYTGMKPHGHYCVPILGNGELFGVLNLYLSPDHSIGGDEKRFVDIVADTLAVILHRNRIEAGEQAVSQELERQMQNLRLANQAFERQAKDLVDLAERLDKERLEAERARSEALHATEAKSQFLANMSHEIRTPMNGVIAMADMLHDTRLNFEQQGMVKVIRDSGAALLGVINDILDFSKIEAGRLALEGADLSLTDLVESVADVLEPGASDKGIALLVFLDPELPNHLQGDPTRLRQILMNLAGNAVKFTERGQVAIEVTAEGITEDAVSVLFRIRDTGIGISGETLENLFQPFTQADNSTARRFGGTGLGLSISSSLVKLMGGRIGVESRLGEGSVFWFSVTFPVVPDRRRVFRNEMTGKRVLLVCEDLGLADILRRYLVFTGAEVVIGDSNLQIQTVLKPGGGERFDVVLLDDGLPEEAAERLFSTVSEGSRIPTVPVLVLIPRSRPPEDPIPRAAATVSQRCSRDIGLGRMVK